MIATFQLPKDGLTYTRMITARCESLIATGIWADMDSPTFRRWFKNFQTDEERYFAACVLDALMYRSKRQTLSLISHLFERVLPDESRLRPTPLGNISNWIERLCSGTEPGFRLVTAVRQGDPPTKSAHVIARYLKRDFEIPEPLIIKAWEVARYVALGVTVFVFIDDFLGTGIQFEEFFRAEGLDRLSGWYPIYAPLVAHESGIQHLTNVLPQVSVVAVEELSTEHNIFDSGSKAFSDGVNTPAVAQNFYCDLLNKYGFGLTAPNCFGFGGLGIAFAFEHAAPDNSLPLLWWNELKDWRPLFPR